MLQPNRYNAATKEVRENPPTGSVPPEAQYLESDDFFTKCRNPMKLAYDPQQELMRKLEDNVPGIIWRGPYQDDDTKKEYFYNSSTFKSQWDHPHKDRIEWQEKVEKAIKENDGWMECEVEVEECTCNKDCQMCNRGAEKSKKETKKKYWWNVSTKESKWEKPKEDKPKEKDFKKDSNWVQIITPDGKDRYWWNVVTRKSKWEKPETEQATKDTNWVQIVTPDGKDKYWWNAVTRESKWEKPKGKK